MADPDRFFRFPTAGAQEWWYFDALSDDGRDVLVIVWYAGLPFDPAFGAASIRHLDNPGRFPKPDPLDHCAIGISWYRLGKTAAYALNGYRADNFSFGENPFGVTVAGNVLERRNDGYRLTVSTPAVDGRSRIRADLRFVPASDTEPFERDLGTAQAPHAWCLGAADCRVTGDVAVDGWGKAHSLSTRFVGRGYHDHNAGSGEISREIDRWEWGRVHHGPLTEVIYHAQPRDGPGQSLWITCRDGRPETIREPLAFRAEGTLWNVFGVRASRTLEMTSGGETLIRSHGPCVDDGPFYRRWLTDFRIQGEREDSEARGIGELLDTKNLNRWMFNWMIPFRLKRPSD